MSLMRAILYWVVESLPEPRIIYDRSGTSPYLSRWYLWRHNSGEGLAVFLHKFHRGDDDLDLHNHPWSWSLAIILSGGYREERRVWAHAYTEMFDQVRTRTLRPGMVNFIRGTDFHRVELLSDEAWSLFIAGPHTGEGWGFWNRLTNQFLPWREFITRKRGAGWVES